MHLLAIMITFNRGEAVYIIGRLSFLFSRPLYLLIVNHFFGNEVAALLAAAFLVSAVLLTVLAVDSHRVYYARYFGTERSNAAFGFSRHIFSQILLSLLGIALCVGYFGLSEHHWLAAFAAALFFVTEKLADEILRFTLFERARSLWGWLMIRRLAPQFLLFGCIVLLSPDRGAAGWMFILALALGNMIAFVPRVPATAVGRLFAHGRSQFVQLRSAIRLIMRSWQLWALSLAAAFSGYNDRLIVLFAKKDDLAIFTLLIVSMSVIQTAVEYFYLSQKRREILEGSINFSDVIKSKSFIRIVVVSMFVGLVISVLNIYLYSNAPKIPAILFLFIAITQISLAATLISREIVYWNNQINAALKVEIIYLSIVTTAFLVISTLGLNYLWMLACSAFALMLRLALFARITPARTTIQFH